ESVEDIPAVEWKISYAVHRNNSGRGRRRNKSALLALLTLLAMLLASPAFRRGSCEHKLIHRSKRQPKVLLHETVVGHLRSCRHCLEPGQRCAHPVCS